MQEIPRTQVHNENINLQISQPVEAGINVGGEMTNDTSQPQKNNLK